MPAAWCQRPSHSAASAVGDRIQSTIVQQPVGSIFTFVRRAALHSYYDDWRACESVARAGYRFGWALNIRAFTSAGTTTSCTQGTSRASAATAASTARST